MTITTGLALDAVRAFLGELESGGQTSASVRRQRSWALREAVLFAAVRRMRDATSGTALTSAERREAMALTAVVPLADLFAPDFVGEWTARADAVLRDVAEPNVATQRARVASLRALAAFAGAEVPAHQAPKPVLRDLLTEPEISSAMLALTRRLPGRGPDDHVRLAAILAVMSVWPVRSGELSAIRLDQVHDTGSGVLLDVAAEGAGGRPVALTGVAADRLRHWLAVRESLVSALQGGPVHALWTSIRSNSRPGGPRGSLPWPCGMPLKPRGLQRAYARSVEAANLVYGGVRGFPLPRSLDLLRRSIGSRPGA
jgi:integrase